MLLPLMLSLLSYTSRGLPIRSVRALRSLKLECIDAQQLGSLPVPDARASREDYLFGNKTLFTTLGVHPSLDLALTKLGKPIATAIQAASFQELLSGKDIVIAAETGAGKTLAFLVPLIHMLMEDDFRESVHYPTAVITVPNKELCMQVQRMATEVLEAIDETDRRITSGTATSATGSWPYRREPCPNILICTPAFLGKFLRGPNILDEDLFRSVRHFVLDEADMLLEGSYLIDIEKILDAFKVVRRQMIRDGEIQVHSSILQNILSAATLPSYGLRSMEKYIEHRFPRATWISNEYLHKHHPRIVQTFHEIPGTSFLTKDRMAIIIRALFAQPISDDDADLSIAFLKDIPSDDDQLKQPEDSTMVFVNTAEVAVELATALRKLGIACAEFHKLQMMADKQLGLQQFREGLIKVLVCTDHAARGLDLPNVKHVIQAEFALNVVQHLHRIGRASRAGVMGKATNIVDERSTQLVDSILADEENRRVDQSFSRRRGFRNKIKKALKRSKAAEEGEEALLEAAPDSEVDDLMAAVLAGDEVQEEEEEPRAA